MSNSRLSSRWKDLLLHVDVSCKFFTLFSLPCSNVLNCVLVPRNSNWPPLLLAASTYWCSVVDNVVVVNDCCFCWAARWRRPSVWRSRTRSNTRSGCEDEVVSSDESPLVDESDDCVDEAVSLGDGAGETDRLQVVLTGELLMFIFLTPSSRASRILCLTSHDSTLDSGSCNTKYNKAKH